MVNTKDAADIAQLVDTIVTRHDQWQDQVIQQLMTLILGFGLGVILLLLITLGFYYLHFRDHKHGKWMLNPDWMPSKPRSND